jgi:hypothetical protein
MSSADSFCQRLSKTLDRVSQVESSEGRCQRQRTRGHFVDRMTLDAIGHGKSGTALSCGPDLSACCATPCAQEDPGPERSVRAPENVLPQRLHVLSPGCQPSAFWCWENGAGSIRRQNSAESVGSCSLTVAIYDCRRALTAWRAALAFLIVMARPCRLRAARGGSGMDQASGSTIVPI